MENTDSVKSLVGPYVLTVGNFDGVHLGHQRVLERLSALYPELKLGVLSFWPHPRENGRPFLLTTRYEKHSLLESLNIDGLVELSFNGHLQKMQPFEFLEMLFTTEKIKVLALGHDFKFGHKREGDFSFAKEFVSKNYPESSVIELPCFGENELGCVPSSTNIRNFIAKGDVSSANKMLGRNFFISGTVIAGVGRGRTIGIPTANIDFDPCKILPKRGVYFCSTIFNGNKYFGLCNIGVNPTFGPLEKDSLEFHIFDFSGDLYGKELKVSFIQRIRDEKKFKTKEELVAQIHQDITLAKDLLK